MRNNSIARVVDFYCIKVPKKGKKLSGEVISDGLIKSNIKTSETPLSQETYIQEVSDRFSKGEELDRNALYKIADKNNVPHENDKDKRIMLQLTEFALVETYRKIARLDAPLREVFNKIVSLYNKQPKIALVTNVTRQFQQYSTAAPIAFLMSKYVLHNSFGSNKYFEPSAGNGMLTMALPQELVDVNEFEEIRYNNLCNYTKYNNVTNLDGTKDFEKRKFYDGIITNPPFGSVDVTENTNQVYLKVDGYELRKKEFVMAYRALECMKDMGRCAIIIGGDLRNDYFDEWGFYKKPADKLFFNYLYKHYNVERIFNINGDLYEKQGTKYNIRLILINGRKSTPTIQKPTLHNDVQNTFDELFKAVHPFVKQDSTNRIRIAQAKIKIETATREREL